MQSKWKIQNITINPNIAFAWQYHHLKKVHLYILTLENYAQSGFIKVSSKFSIFLIFSTVFFETNHMIVF